MIFYILAENLKLPKITSQRSAGENAGLKINSLQSGRIGDNNNSNNFRESENYNNNGIDHNNNLERIPNIRPGEGILNHLRILEYESSNSEINNNYHNHIGENQRGYEVVIDHSGGGFRYETRPFIRNSGGNINMNMNMVVQPRVFVLEN